MRGVWLGVSAAAMVASILILGPFVAFIMGICICILLIVFRRPRWLVYAVVFTGMTAYPEFVPYGVNVGSVTVYLYEPILFLAAAWTILAKPPRGKVLAVLGIVLGLAGIWGFAGLAAGHTLTAVSRDARGAVAVALFALVAAGVYQSGHRRGAVRVLTVSLWISAAVTAAGWLFNVPLAGRSEQAGLWLVSGGSPADVAATRYLTSASEFATLALCVALALLIVGKVSFRQALPVLVPAAFLTTIGFSRNSLAAVAVAAALAAIFARRRAAAARAVLNLAVLVAALGLVGTLVVAAGAPGAEQIEALWAGFTDRVLGGISGETLAMDSSARSRVTENAYAFSAFQQAPLLGHGFGFAYRPTFGDVGSFTATTGAYYIHNYWLWLLVKAGAVGLVLMIIALVVPAFRAVVSRSPELNALGAAMLGLVVSMIWAPFVNDANNGGSLAVGLLFGVLLAAESVESAKHVSSVSVKFPLAASRSTRGSV